MPQRARHLLQRPFLSVLYNFCGQRDSCLCTIRKACDYQSQPNISCQQALVDALLSNDLIDEAEDELSKLNPTSDIGRYSKLYKQHILSIKKKDEAKAVLFADSAYLCLERMYSKELDAKSKYYQNVIHETQKKADAQRLAKNVLVSKGLDTSVNKIQYALLGDPALSLALPTYNAVIDSINGIAANGDSIPQLRAGDKVNIKGHMELGGKKADTFSGILDAMVRDTEETIKCKLNNTTAEGADTAFIFTDRKNTLYHGTGKVENGEFSFNFAVPKDINYSDGTGLMNLYAFDNNLKASAHGAYDKFTVNGSNIADNDSIGPAIYCYLNSEDFTFGGNVNNTPLFVAQISDKDGINASGAGIGHDMELVIDGDASMAYNLNENFTFDYESYTSGQTYFALPVLAAGKHTLKFRAWDILNNSSAVTLDFVVKNDIQPNITDVYVTNNPARENTTFVVNHNFYGSNIDLVIEVMDASGRLLWSHSKNYPSASNTINYKWDLTTDSGAKLQTGIYLYRVKLGNNGSYSSTKARKLLIIQ